VVDQLGDAEFGKSCHCWPGQFARIPANGVQPSGLARAMIDARDRPTTFKDDLAETPLRLVGLQPLS
jgi:hypothetical protein